VAWFAGFAPAEGPRIAFAVVYEGDPNRNDVHGGTHAAPMIGKVLREYFKDPAKIKPVYPKDEDGNDIPPPVIPVTPKKVEPASGEPDQEGAPMEPTPAESAPARTPFWKRIFG